MNKSDLFKAIDLALHDKWDESHRLVQDYDDEFASWIHAVLHKIEGDDGNSRYWYRRSGKEFNDSMSPKAELELIKRELS